MFHIGTLTVYEGRTYFKILVTGQMTSSNILQTCNQKNKKAACYTSSYGDSNCVIANNGVTYIFALLSKAICHHGNPSSCGPLTDVYTYMKGKSYGFTPGLWANSGTYNRFALCVET